MQILKGLIAGIVLGICGCSGGGSSGGGSTGTPQDLLMGGIYLGSLTQGGTVYDLTALLNEEGDGIFLVSLNGATLSIISPVSVVTTSGAFSVPNSGTYAVDGSGYVQAGGEVEPASITGTAAQRRSISGTLTDADDSSPFSLTYDAADYDKPSSTAMIAGSYTFSCGTGCTGTMTVESSGSFTATTTRAATAQTYTGTISPPDTSYNFYYVTATWTNPGSNAPQVNYTGAATFNPGVTGQPPTLSFAAAGQEAVYWQMTQ